MKRYLFLFLAYCVSFASHAQTYVEGGAYSLSDKEWIDIGSNVITAFFASQQVQLLNSLSGKDTIFLYTTLTKTPDMISLLKAQNSNLYFVDEEHCINYYWYGTEFQLSPCTTYETCRKATFLTSFIIDDKEVSIGASIEIIDGKWEVVSFDLYNIEIAAPFTNNNRSTPR